jgi:hypothetical protein
MAFCTDQKKRAARERIIRAAEILAQNPIEEQIYALRDNGFSEGEAHRLVALLPLAFSRPVLEALGVKHFGPMVTAIGRDGTSVEASLMRQPEYVDGLELARIHRQRGVMDREVYKRVASSSADIDAVGKALTSGVSVIGATVASSLIGPDIAEHLVR